MDPPKLRLNEKDAAQCYNAENYSLHKKSTIQESCVCYATNVNTWRIKLVWAPHHDFPYPAKIIKYSQNGALELGQPRRGTNFINKKIKSLALTVFEIFCLLTDTRTNYQYNSKNFGFRLLSGELKTWFGNENWPSNFFRLGK